ncbi:MAG TPA: ankyrin repeat domain-containing protein [Acidobacteriota bacterium]
MRRRDPDVRPSSAIRSPWRKDRWSASPTSRAATGRAATPAGIDEQARRPLGAFRPLAAKRLGAIFALALGLPTLLSAAPGQGGASPVADAAMRNDVEAVRTLLRQGADVNVPQNDGMTALHWASRNGRVEIVEMLVYAGAHLEAGTRIGSYTPLHLAGKAGDAAMVAALLEAGADANAATAASGATALHFAAAAGSAPTITTLLDYGANPNATETAWGNTPLMFAAAANYVGAVAALVERGADISLSSTVVDVVERTESDRVEQRIRDRQAAAFKEIEEEARAEGEPAQGEEEKEGEENKEGEAAGVEGEQKAEQGAEGETPKEAEQGAEAEKPKEGEQPEAEKSKQGEQGVEIEKPKAEQGAEAEKPKEGEQPETEKPKEVEGGAAAEGEETEAGEEKEEGAAEEGEKPEGEADEKEEEKRPPSYAELVGGHGGLTALLYAAREGHVETVEALLDAGADIDAVSGGDHTSPLLIATLNGHFDLAMLLLERGADPNIASDAGATPLYVALNVRWAPRSAYPQQNAYKQQRTAYLDLMAALLENGADPNVRLSKHLWYTSFNFDHLLDSTGATPFWRAAYATDVEAMRLLVAHGADPNIPTSKLPSRGRPRPQGEDGKEKEEGDPSGLPPVPVGGPAVYPLHAASGAGYGEGFAGYAHQHAPGGWMPAVKYLVEELGADVGVRDHNAYNAIHHAASRGDFEMVLYLVRQRGDVRAVSRKGQSTADMANGPVQRIQPFPRTVWLLERLGAKNNDNCVSC